MSWNEEQLSAIVKKSKARAVHPGGMNKPSERKPAMGKPKATKYRAVRTTVDGITFASKKEAKRYAELLLLQKAGEISDLSCQPVIKCTINGVHICDYRGDFFYCDLETANCIWEDCKGFKTPVYRLKKKLVLALTGIKIRET